MAENEKEAGCGCGHDHEHGCCGGHGDGEHQCCGGHGHADGEHKCCGGHGHGDGEHKCCGGHGHDEGSAPDFDAMADFPMPKPTLITVATTLAQQAMISMGILPNPMTNQTVFLLNQATYLIDTVELIYEKTAGNRTDEETKVLENIVHELRMLFVAASNEKQRRDAEKKND